MVLTNYVQKWINDRNDNKKKENGSLLVILIIFRCIVKGITKVRLYLKEKIVI